jgi:hypothetical protein
MQTTSDIVLGEAIDGIATITLNLPDKLNAMTRDMAVRLMSLLDAFDTDDEVRAIIITGTGRAFCAGADLRAGDSVLATGANNAAQSTPMLLDGSIDWSHDEVRDFGGRVTLRLFESTKPYRRYQRLGGGYRRYFAPGGRFSPRIDRQQVRDAVRAPRHRSGIRFQLVLAADRRNIARFRLDVDRSTDRFGRSVGERTGEVAP